MHAHLDDYCNPRPVPTGPTITGPLAAMVLRGQISFTTAQIHLARKATILVGREGTRVVSSKQ